MNLAKKLQLEEKNRLESVTVFRLYPFELNVASSCVT